MIIFYYFIYDRVVTFYKIEKKLFNDNSLLICKNLVLDFNGITTEYYIVYNNSVSSCNIILLKQK